ncbi:MAG: hypothetical protein CMM49_05235 [Rhodospirillaceae bacterium]|nr:hypothetical protein [Rhodospirillaceae bacterium]|tara:strand:- start:652 stop:1563 length:912 start_codon:yes stop_codon:yes gene_type:complete
MSWNDLKLAFNKITHSAKNKKFVESEWEKFELLAKKVNHNCPDFLVNLVSSLKKAGKNKNKDKIFILDHGCGSALKSFYFIALGYTNIYGVNKNDEVDHLNLILKKKFSISEKRFFTTEGKLLPFIDNKFDFIFSLQVLEHVQDNCIELYYSEEARVLKKNGYAFHEVPHLLVPYDSHSRLWFAHWFPKFLQPMIYGVFKSLQNKQFLLHEGAQIAKKYNGEFLMLRTPKFHYQRILKYMGSFNELTLERLVRNTNFDNYDKDNPILLRKILYYIFKVPILGLLLARLLKNFFMLQTLSKKTI